MTSENGQPASPGLESSDPVEGTEESARAESYLDSIAEQGGDFTPENVDAFLEIQDPDFSKELSDIKGDSNLTAVEAEIDDATAALHDEIARWREAKGFGRVAYSLLPVLPYISLGLKRFHFRLIAFIQATRIRLQHFLYYLLTTGRRRLQAKLLEGLSAFKNWIAGGLTAFREMSLKLKLAVIGMLLMAFAAPAALYLLSQGKLLPQPRPLFLLDLATHASETFEIEETTRLESFYDNARISPNLLLIEKVVVNIRASEDSGPNPMVALEVIVEGLNPDVVIEVKDREALFRDLLQRTVEEFSFGQLSSPEGKQRLVQGILKEMNRNLTTGELRNVRIKTFILKP